MKKFSFVWLLLLAVLVSGCDAPLAAASVAVERPQAAAGLEVYFIDVGNADAILVRDGLGAVLVDAGNNGDGEDILRFLEERGVRRLNYAIGTHPHEDHIGGLDDVLRGIDVGSLILPEKESDTQTYLDVLDAMEDERIPRIEAEAGLSYEVGGFTLKIIGPARLYEDMNNNSVVARIEYGDTAFLLPGDIEEAAEKDILAQGYDISCDVLKAPHHGSETSSSYLFLRQSNPESVVILCGEGNSYGHPHEGPLSRYRDLGATVYRTDTMGTVAFYSDGQEITVSVLGEASPRKHTAGGGLAGGSTIETSAYIGNVNSKVFHTPECASLPAEKNRVSFANRKAALDAGYKPCSRCKP